jgi:hypothetical protein
MSQLMWGECSVERNNLGQEISIKDSPKGGVRKPLENVYGRDVVLAKIRALGPESSSYCPDRDPPVVLASPTHCGRLSGMPSYMADAIAEATYRGLVRCATLR